MRFSSYVQCATVILLLLSVGGVSGRRKRPRTTVVERGLVKAEDVRGEEVLAHHAECSTRASHVHYTTGKTLGYVTPWNSRGYTLASVFARKFDILSPVWFQLRIKKRKRNNKDKNKGKGEEEEGKMGSFHVSLAGHDAVDKTWAAKVQAKGAKVYPRVLIEASDMSEYVALLSTKAPSGVGVGSEISGGGPVLQEGVALIREMVEEGGYDGVVLDTGGVPVMRISSGGFVTLVSELSKATSVIIVAPPAHPSLDQEGSRQRFDWQDLEEIHPYIEAVSLMSYDASSGAAPGPSSPLSWIETTLGSLLPPPSHPKYAILAQKILLGINFYAADYTLPAGGGPILCSQVLSILGDLIDSGSDPVLQWDAVAAEHVLSYTLPTSGTSHLLYTPSLAYIQTRLDLATSASLGGIAIWELGQGLDYFFDLL